VEGDPLSGLEMVALAGDGPFVIGPCPGAFGDLGPEFDHCGIGKAFGDEDVDGEEFGALRIGGRPAQRQGIDADGGLAVAGGGGARKLQNTRAASGGICNLRQGGAGITPPDAPVLRAFSRVLKIKFDLRERQTAEQQNCKGYHHHFRKQFHACLLIRFGIVRSTVVILTTSSHLQPVCKRGSPPSFSSNPALELAWPPSGARRCSRWYVRGH